MPIYEFVCQECHQKFEELCKCNTEQIPCPQCGSDKTKRLFSSFAVSGKSGATGSSSCSCSSCGGGHCSTCH